MHRRERYQHIHVTVPPVIADLIRSQAEATYRSQGQIITDAILALYGGNNGAGSGTGLRATNAGGQ